MPNNRPPRILLIEDDDDHADLVRRTLDELGLRSGIDHVTDGESALEFLRGHPRFGRAERPDLVLLDLRLPRMDGQEVLEAIRADGALSDLPVIVLATSTDECTSPRTPHAAADGYLVKPVPAEALRLAIRELKPARGPGWPKHGDCGRE